MRVWLILLFALGLVLPPALYTMHAPIELPAPEYRASSLADQALAVATFFGVKLIYSGIAAWLVVALWGRMESDLKALRLAMIWFFIGEAACFVGVMVFHDRSIPVEHLHSAGMVISLAYAWWALFEGLDQRLIHYSGSGKCAAAPLCHGCIKHQQVSCSLQRLFLFLIPGLALLAFLPLTSSLRTEGYATTVFGTEHLYRHPIVHQLYELRYLPTAALVLFALSFVVLLRERHPAPIARILCSAALGALSFSYLRLLMVAGFADKQVWFGAWEELTELVYVAIPAAIILVFWNALLPTASTAAQRT